MGNVCQPIICTMGQVLVGNVCTCPGGMVFTGAGCQRHRQQNPAQDQAEGGGAMAAFHVAWGGMGAAGDGHGFA